MLMDLLILIESCEEFSSISTELSLMGALSDPPPQEIKKKDKKIKYLTYFIIKKNTHQRNSK